MNGQNAKYTPHFLSKLEAVMAESEYILRYEKGNFKSGYCILKDQKVAIINKFYTLEGKINSLIEILRTLDLNVQKLNDKNKSIYQEIMQTNLKF